jgi:hypothetical protein
MSLTMAACAGSGMAVAVLMNAKMAIVELERFSFDRRKLEFIYAFTLHFEMAVVPRVFKEMNVHAAGESAYEVERALSLPRALRC